MNTHLFLQGKHSQQETYMLSNIDKLYIDKLLGSSQFPVTITTKKKNKLPPKY